MIKIYSIVTLIPFFLGYIQLSAQTWDSKASLPNNIGKHHPVTFGIDGFGYSVTGTSASSQTSKDFFKYDPVNDSWSKLTDFPGAARSFAIGQAYNGKAYMGFGYQFNFLNDLSMIQYFKNIEGQTVEIDNPEVGVWVNLVPPFKEEEFIDLSEKLDIPIEFLRDSLDIDERPRYEIENNVKFVVIKTPTENNSFNDSDAFYITIPICIILTHTQIITVNSFDNGAINKFLNSFQKRHPDKKNMMILKVFEKVVQNFMEFLKEINIRRNQYESSLYQSNSNVDLLNLMRIQKSLVYFVTALRSNEMLMMKLERCMLQTNFPSTEAIFPSTFPLMWMAEDVTTVKEKEQ